MKMKSTAHMEQATRKMSNRFDFEQQIMKCWNVTDEIHLLYESVMENDKLSKDDIANFLLGLHTIYEVKFDKLFTQFENLVAEKKIT